MNRHEEIRLIDLLRGLGPDVIRIINSFVALFNASYGVSVPMHGT